MSKYIIKNCPALQQTYYCNTYHSKCQDCINCVMKQIVEECNNAKIRTNDYSNDSAYNEANRILDLLDIQEVES